MLIVPHALHCVDSCIFVFYLIWHSLAYCFGISAPQLPPFPHFFFIRISLFVKIHLLERSQLEQRWVDASVIMLYKIIHGVLAISLPVYFEQLSRQTRHSHPLAFRQIHTTANYYKYSFFPSPCLTFTGTDCQLRLSCCLHLISLVWQFGLSGSPPAIRQQHSCF